jgi:hypothetical protein
MYLAGDTKDEILRITKLMNEQLLTTIAKKVIKLH